MGSFNMHDIFNQNMSKPFYVRLERRWISMVRTWSIACDCRLNTKMAKLLLTVVFVLIFQTFSPLDACDETAVKDKFDINHKEIQRRMIKGKRLSKTIPSLLSREVFTAMECLDTCLRFDQCTVFDLDASSHQKVCVIHGAVKSPMPFVEEESWMHFNLSAEFLRQVR